LWIITSDKLIGVMADAPASLARLQTYKDWLFVAVSAALLYAVGRKATDAALSDGRIPAGFQYGIGQATMSVSKLQLLIIAASIVLVSATVLLVSYGQRAGREAVLHQGRENVENLARLIEAQTLHAVESVDLTLRSLSVAIRLAPAADAGHGALQEQMQQTAKSLFHVRAVFVVNERGELILDTDTQPGTEINFSDREYFAAHRENPALGLFVGAPINSRTMGKAFIAVSRRIEKAGGGFGGVIVAAVEEQYFQGLYASLNVGREGVVAMYLRNGTLLVRAPRAEREVGKSFALRPVLRELLEKSPSGAYRGVSPIDGLERIFSYRTVEDFPLVVFVGLSEREILAEWFRAARIEILTALFFVLVILILTYTLIVQLRRREVLIAALNAGEQRYRYLFDANPQPMWIYDYETLEFIAVNDATVNMYGYTREEFLSLSILDIRPQDDVDRIKQRIKAFNPAENRSGIWRHKKKDGALIYVDIVSHGFNFEGHKARLVLASNVTERLRVENALRESEQRLRTITDNIPALIGYVDSGQRYRFANNTYKDWNGDAPEQIYGRTLREVMGDEYYVQIQPHIKTVLAGQSVTFEIFARLRVRELYARITYHPDIGAQGRVEGFYVLGYDITERKKAEEALASERTLLRHVIDNLPDRINVKDRERRYLLLNAASLKSRGIADHSEVLGKSVFDFFPPDMAAQYDAEDCSVMETGRALLNREQCTIQDDGQKKWHLTTKVPLRNLQGEIIGIVGINRDVTEIKRGQEMIRELNALLEQRVIERTAQLESTNQELESFSYSVSHDLRAPLRSIDGFSMALLEDYRDSLDKTALGYLQRIRNASQRMSALIDDLLELSRITRREIHREVVDLSMLAQEIVADLKKEQPERAVGIRITPGIRLQADANLLRIALDNLIRNAWKFTGKQTHAKIEVGMEQQTGESIYFVSDNGVGFDKNYAGKLFGAFQRLHSDTEFPGTGIGLATVLRVVRRHGGNVWAEAVPGKGATFFFTMGSTTDC
jgi:PAS domain S-box-containing protein